MVIPFIIKEINLSFEINGVCVPIRSYGWYVILRKLQIFTEDCWYSMNAIHIVWIVLNSQTGRLCCETVLFQ